MQVADQDASIDALRTEGLDVHAQADSNQKLADVFNGPSDSCVLKATALQPFFNELCYPLASALPEGVFVSVLCLTFMCRLSSVLCAGFSVSCAGFSLCYSQALVCDICSVEFVLDIS